MTVSSEQSDVSYDGDGVTLVFPIPFYFLEDSDLFVNEVTADGIESPLSLGTDYTVSGAGSQAGGALTLLGLPTPVGKRLLIDRDPPATQETAYQANDPFPAAEHEKALDKLTMLVQRLTRTYFNALHFPLSESTDGTLPQKSARLGMIQGYDPVNGAPIMVPMPASVGAGDLLPYTLVAGVDFNPGDTFVTLPRAPSLPGNVSVFFDAVPRDFGQWSVSGATLTFNAPIPAFVTKIWGYIGTTLSTLVPPNSSIIDQMVAANAAIKASKLSYVPGFTGASTRTVDSKLRETISVKDFGAVGDGVTDDTAAFSAAIAYANSLNPGDIGDINIKGVTIFIPDGRYLITSNVTPILKGGIAIRGSSQDGARLILSYNGPTFTWNTTGSASYVVTGSFSDVTIEYPSAPPINAMIWYLEQSFRIIFRNINLVNVRRIMQLGSGARICGAIGLENVIGYVYNGGSPAIIPASGAGLFISNSHFFVGGVGAPPIDRVTTMTTVPGTNFIQCDSSTWDTIQITGCTIERFYYGIYCNATSGIILNNFYVANTYFDYHAAHAVFFSSLSVGTGGIFSMKFTGCWFASWDNSAVQFQGPGAIRFIEFDNCSVVSAGTYGYFIDGINTSGVQIKGGTVSGTNRRNLAASAIAYNAGTKVTISGLISGLDSTADGFPWQAVYGLWISADLDGYTVTDCEFAGLTAPVLLGANAAGSQSRIFKNNRGANLHLVNAVPVVTSGVPFVNTFPHAIRFNTFGGTVSGISLNGNGINSAVSGQFILNPGDSITVSYSIAPSFSYSGIN